MSVLAAIGNTPLVRLHHVVPTGCARIVVKVEGANPTGSMKDRMAQAMVAGAEAGGRLRAGGTIVEYTGGSTGASLALIAAVRGYRLRIVTSDAFSEDKIAHMAALGADLIIIPSPGRVITKQVTESMVEAARKISQEPDTYWTDQLTNTHSIAGYHPMGEEIWQQTGGTVAAFVQAVGTTASLQGVGTVLRAHHPGVRIIAAEPAESAVLSGGINGAHRIDGIGIGYVPPMWNPEIVDEVFSASTEEAEAMARRLAREEGLFAGTSSGLNVLGAIHVGRQLGPGATVATLLIDSGLKYLASGLYKRQAYESR
jgi:cysteine synthase